MIRHRGRVLTVCGVVFFAAIIGFSYSHVFALSQCLAFFEGSSGILMISCFNVSIQHLSSDAMRGRDDEHLRHKLSGLAADWARWWRGAFAAH